MKEETKLILIRNIGLLLVVVIVFIIYDFKMHKCCICGVTTGNFFEDMTCCAPCPNKYYVKEVSDYAGYEPSGAGSWYDMCKQYQKETNKTFECFE